jgi:trans-2,3-dihydro-3-hydroxyanthranilate isomerase
MTPLRSTRMQPVRYHHVDVFTDRPYSGNSLAVFPDSEGLTGTQMDRITKELRHFESIFLESASGDRARRARVFDLVEELDFAGHPVIGAACVLHALAGSKSTERWTIHLKARTVTVETERRSAALYAAVLAQGAAEFLGTPDPATREEIAAWFSLSATDLDPRLAPQVVSTGLRYLVLPVRSRGLAAAHIAVADLETKLASLGAQYAYLIDAESLEGRHWSNDGAVEDVATGSGAGCVTAYLRRHGRIQDGEIAILQQGRFVGRPSKITLRARGGGTDVCVEVGGTVSLVGEGRLDALPE